LLHESDALRSGRLVKLHVKRLHGSSATEHFLKVLTMKGPLVLYALSLLLLSAGPLSGQLATRELSLSAGAMGYDASGTGTVPMVAVRASTPLVARWMLGELSLSYAALDEQFSTENTRIGVVEAQFHAQLPAARVRPYLGIGGGLLTYFNNAVGRTSPAATYSAAVGLRVPVSPLLLRGELRLRGWKSRPDSDGMLSGAEGTIGIGYSF
jgi:hypothetical protein